MRFLSLIIGLLVSPAVLAWSADGHRLIAELAQAQLSPAARQQVDQLLSLEPGATMVSVSTWADERRSPATSRLHFVNMPEGECTYSQQRDCSDRRCVVEAINTKVAILKSDAPDAERLAALKWVIHLVGDIHQPLHVGLANDKGGNLFQLRAFGRGSNLHAVWDGELIRRRAGGLSRLLQDAIHAQQAASVPADPAAWASGSCKKRVEAGFYPPGRAVEAAYAAKWDATLVTELRLAGRRLAETLNDVASSASRLELLDVATHEADDERAGQHDSKQPLEHREKSREADRCDIPISNRRKR